MTTARIAWDQFRSELGRMSFLPGFERLEEQHWAEFYELMSGYYPHEVKRAVGRVLSDPETKFFPPPGRLVGLMLAHRRTIGRDWDTVKAGLKLEAAGGDVPAIAEREGGWDRALGIPGADDIGRLA